MNGSEQTDDRGRLTAEHGALRRTVSVAGIVAAVVLSAACSSAADVVQSPRVSGDVRASQSPDADFLSEDGRMSVSQVRQMGVIIETPAAVIYTDPTGGGHAYAGHPAPDIVLVSHEHRENYDIETLGDLVGPDTLLVVPPLVLDSLPERLRESAVPLANGERSESAGITIEAIPAYGLGGEAERWHPRGNGNGYVLTIGDRRVYVAGSTEAIPEMLALDDIYLALLPLYPPYALGPEEAVRAVSTVRPQYTYIYQYNSEGTRDDFVKAMDGAPTEMAIVAPQISS
ncbi:MBL fold metallo-hydrolase [Actinoplanes sp. M2I2]|uniref:MBL fold metallo-hydrolase n=1 Tax=Actinoplanes sp. M2I2 TaxID=1734444 RepID=UPI0020217F06|nr:MBL fold metallo-hydrolase [Actinoplanes sp. M2I2]